MRNHIGYSTIWCEALVPYCYALDPNMRTKSPDFLASGLMHVIIMSYQKLGGLVPATGLGGCSTTCRSYAIFVVNHYVMYLGLSIPQARVVCKEERNI